MNCKCLKQIAAKLKEHHKADEVELDLRATVNTKTLDVGTAMPPLYYKYRIGKKIKKSHLVFNYCPFCGTKGGKK